VVENADEATMHALRIEFKRLRYAVSFFESVLGQSIEGFIEQLKVIQDLLGRLNDIRVAGEIFGALSDENLDDAQVGVIRDYLAAVEAERATLQAEFVEVWGQFNSRVVQRKLSDSMLVLR
jgi:CHAD domain-containing protein